MVDGRCIYDSVWELLMPCLITASVASENKFGSASLSSLNHVDTNK